MHRRRIGLYTLFLFLTLGLTVTFPSAAFSAGSIDETFQKGKTLYYRGDYQGALATWDSIKSELERPENISTKRMVYFLTSRIQAQAGASAVPKPIVKSQPAPSTVIVQPPARVKAPAELPQVLSEADRKLKDETARWACCFSAMARVVSSLSFRSASLKTCGSSCGALTLATG